ncbi:MAG: hypothetical protein AAF680_00220 [Pseudomonadota bacterium]
MEITLSQLALIYFGSILVCAPPLVWMAKRLGLSATGWGVMGVLFPFNAIAVFVLLIFSLLARVPVSWRLKIRGPIPRLSASFLLAVLMLGAAVGTLAVIVQPVDEVEPGLVIASFVICVPILAWMARTRGFSTLGGALVGLLYPLNAVACIALLFVPLKRRAATTLAGQPS